MRERQHNAAAAHGFASCRRLQHGPDDAGSFGRAGPARNLPRHATGLDGFSPEPGGRTESCALHASLTRTHFDS
jgi:hypothetical protein